MLKQYVLAVSLLAVSAITPARADVLTFDDLNTGGSTVLMPSVYGGFAWDARWALIDNSFYNFVFFDTTPFPTSPNAVLNRGGVVTIGVSGAPFSFDGADFATNLIFDRIAASSSASVTVNGFLNGNLVGTASMDLAADGEFTFLNAPATFGDIDTLLVSNDGTDGHFWLMDNFTFGAPVTTPEPSSSIGLLTVLGGFGFHIRKKCRRQAKT